MPLLEVLSSLLTQFLATQLKQKEQLSLSLQKTAQFVAA